MYLTSRSAQGEDVVESLLRVNGISLLITQQQAPSHGLHAIYFGDGAQAAARLVYSNVAIRMKLGIRKK
jgi:hypothetical protein